MDVKIGEIIQAVGGKALVPLDEAALGLCVRAVSTDTRTIEKGDAFFALQGPKYDGHDFLKEAVARGAAVCVVSDPKRVSADLKKSCSFIRVADTLRAYGDLARFYRGKFRIPVIAITGSAGKTTTKELIAHVLSQRFKVLKNRGTENNLVGVPKTIFQLEPQHEVLVL
ncbi:MAG TPA: Mur ligase family protein, partial [Candidatus Eisenbacteria bacterium]|nr:Mur ligase family protein [Candidatus Eisenbacteria bacterium]